MAVKERCFCVEKAFFVGLCREVCFGNIFTVKIRRCNRLCNSDLWGGVFASGKLIKKNSKKENNDRIFMLSLWALLYIISNKIISF